MFFVTWWRNRIILEFVFLLSTTDCETDPSLHISTWYLAHKCTLYSRKSKVFEVEFLEKFIQTFLSICALMRKQLLCLSYKGFCIEKNLFERRLVMHISLWNIRSIFKRQTDNCSVLNEFYQHYIHYYYRQIIHFLTENSISSWVFDFNSSSSK
jgi:hypothetical protein